MRQKLLLYFLVSILLVSIVLFGCAQPATPPKTTPPPTTTTPAAPKVITLKYADQNPEVGWAGEHAAKPWLKSMEDATKGAIKIEGYYAQSLFKGADAWESVKAGQSDIAWCFHGYWPNLTPLADVIALPFLGVPSGEIGGAIMWQLYQKFPSIQKQFADNKILLIWTTSPYYLLTVNKQVKTVDDIKGMKIRTVGGPPTEMMKALGGVPVMMGMPDVYLNLEKGVIDGILDTWEAIYSFKKYEVAKYLTLLPFHASYFSQAFNTQKWNSLSPDIQNQIMSVCGLPGSRFWGKNMFDTAEAAVGAVIKQKNFPWVTYTPPAADVAAFRKIGGEPLWEVWVKAMEAKGFSDAREILNTTLQLVKDTK